MQDIPPNLAVDPLLDGSSYDERLDYFRERIANSLTRSDQFIFVGSGCSLKVVHGALHLQQGSLRGVKPEPVILYPGIHNISQIVFISSSGFLSLDAIHWCNRNGISIAIVGNDGHLIGSCTPSSGVNANLRRLQYRECSTDVGISIARELVRKKIDAQVATLKRGTFPYKKTPIRQTITRTITEAGLTMPDTEEPSLPFQPVWYYLEQELPGLERLQSLDRLRMVEARCGVIYWYAYFGTPIKWKAKDAKIVPPHWKTITERTSPLSSTSTARRAINPFHAALNYMYAVTEHQLLNAIHVEGLNPACGFLHADASSNSSLVYDLVEPLRAVVDGKVLSFFVRETFRRGDFTLGSDGRVLFNPELLRFLVASCKLDDTIPGGMVFWLKSRLLETM